MAQIDPLLTVSRKIGKKISQMGQQDNRRQYTALEMDLLDRIVREMRENDKEQRMLEQMFVGAKEVIDEQDKFIKELKSLVKVCLNETERLDGKHESLQREFRGLKEGFNLMHELWNDDRDLKEKLERTLMNELASTKGRKKSGKQFRKRIDISGLHQLLRLLQHANDEPNWTKIGHALGVDAKTAKTRAEKVGLYNPKK